MNWREDHFYMSRGRSQIGIDPAYDAWERKKKDEAEFRKSRSYKMMREIARTFEDVGYSAEAHWEVVYGIAYLHPWDIVEDWSILDYRDINEMVMIRQMYTHPKWRGQGRACKGLEQIRSISDSTGCSVFGIANPFTLRGVDEDATTREIAKKLRYAERSMDMDKETPRENIRRIFQRAGYANFRIDPRCLGDKSITPEDCFCHIPNGATEEFKGLMDTVLLNDGLPAPLIEKGGSSPSTVVAG